MDYSSKVYSGKSYGSKNKLIAILSLCVLTVIIAISIIIKVMGDNQGYRTITVVDVSGTVAVVKDGIEYGAYEGMHLEEGHEIITSGNSYVRLVLDGNKYIKLEEGSRLVFETLGLLGSGKTKLCLERGSITNELVTPLNQDEEYIIHTPNAILAVRGTFFRVDLNTNSTGELIADVVTYGGKVATKRVFPDGEIIEEDVLVEAGKKACINMDTEKTYFVVEGTKLEDTDEDKDKEKTENIVIEDISNDDLVDIYFASKNGHEVFVSEDEAKEKIEERNISIDEYVPVYEKTKEVLEQIDEGLKYEENKVVNHKVYADDSKELPREETTVEDNKSDDKWDIPVTDGTGEVTTETTTNSEDELTSDLEDESTTDSEEETTTNLEDESTSDLEDESTTETEEETTTKSEEETTTDSEEETTTDSEEETTTKSEEETTSKSEEEATTKSEEETTSKSEEETTEHQHTYTEKIITEATCTAEGKKVKQCTVCNDIAEEYVIPLADHDYETGYTVDIEATCTAGGLKSRHCRNCSSRIDTTDIPMISHEYEAKTDLPTDTKDGRDYEQCKYCDEIVNEVSFLGINAVNFPDVVLRTYIEDNFNTDGEAGLRQAEIDAATFLQIQYDINNLVSDLSGIEHFTSLEVLAIGDARNIEDGDIDVSKNTALISLSIPYGAFTTLDVSNNKELKMLNLTAGKLTSIEVGHLSDLETLYVDNTEIDDLDVSSLASLKTLFCGGTNITELDVTECSSLTTLSVENCQLLETLNAYDTNITGLVTDNCMELDTLDISGCAALSSVDLSTNENLKYLYLTDTAITTIDLANNIYIEELYINGNIGNLDVYSINTLRKLYIGDGTALTTLDLSDKYNLTELIFYGQKGITTLNLEGCISMTDITPSQLNSLSELNIKGTGITEIYLGSNTSLKKLNIANTEISELDISLCTELTDLDVSGCSELTGVDVSNNPALVNYNASGSGLLSIDATSNMELKTLNLSNCTSLKSFTMNNDISNYMLETLDISGCSALLFFDASLLPNVTELDLSSCISLQNLTLSACTGITGTLDLSGLSNLTTVNIDNCSGITEINLQNKTNLSSLYAIECEGLAQIDISGCTSLVNLDVSGNRALTGIDISTNTMLYSLNLSDTSITSFKNIVISTDNGIRELSIGSSSFDSINLDYTEAGIDLSWLSGLKIFNANYGQISDADWAVIEAALPVDLQELHLQGNGASENDSGLPNEYLTSLDVSKFSRLTILDISYNESLVDLNISNATSLDLYVNSEHIAGLTGLENVTALNMDITFLNLAGLQNLKTIDCTGSWIESISVRGCTSLETIDLTNINSTETTSSQIMMDVSYTGYSFTTFDTYVTVIKSAYLSIDYVAD